jgi:chlorophyll(ide) b reductase
LQQPTIVLTLEATHSLGKLNMITFLSITVASLALFGANAFAPSGPVGRSSMQTSSALSMSAGGVVITGSAGGVGFAYAGEFMDRGYDVVICDVRDCTSAASALESRHPNGKVYHTKCDVSDADAVAKLGEFAKKNLGTINHWINNAGINGGRRDLRDVPMEQVELVIKVNLLGTLFCTKVAMDIMGEQVSKTWFRLYFILCLLI